MPNDQSHGLISRAVLALQGLLGRPEKEIARLLRSEIDLNPKVRNMLADALEGKKGTIGLKVTGRSKMQSERSYRRCRERIRRGKMAEVLMAQGSQYDDAITKVAQSEGRGPKTVLGDVAIARKAHRWIAERRLSSEGQLNWNDEVMEILFAMAKARKVDPDQIFFQALEETKMAEERWRR